MVRPLLLGQEVFFPIFAKRLEAKESEILYRCKGHTPLHAIKLARTGTFSDFCKVNGKREIMKKYPLLEDKKFECSCEKVC